MLLPVCPLLQTTVPDGAGETKITALAPSQSGEAVLVTIFGAGGAPPELIVIVLD